MKSFTEKGGGSMKFPIGFSNLCKGGSMSYSCGWGNPIKYRFQTGLSVLFTLAILLSGCTGFKANDPAVATDSMNIHPEVLAARIAATGGTLQVTSAAQNVTQGACSNAVTVELLTSSGSANTFRGSVGVPLSSSASNITAM